MKTIVGKDQMVYWKGCNVTANYINSEGKVISEKLKEMSDGQGMVKHGTKLYIVKGKVKEE